MALLLVSIVYYLISPTLSGIKSKIILINPKLLFNQNIYYRYTLTS